MAATTKAIAINVFAPFGDPPAVKEVKGFSTAGLNEEIQQQTFFKAIGGRRQQGPGAQTSRGEAAGAARGRKGDTPVLGALPCGPTGVRGIDPRTPADRERLLLKSCSDQLIEPSRLLCGVEGCMRLPKRSSSWCVVVRLHAT